MAVTSPAGTPALHLSPWAGLDSQQMEEEIGILKDKLRAAQGTLERTRAEMHTQRMRTRQLVMAWKHRLQQKEDKLRRERIHRDRELQEISQQLLFFEGQLKQEQQQIKTMLVEKDQVIGAQNGRIMELTEANTKLTLAIHSFKSRLKSDAAGAASSGNPACSSGSADFYLGDNADNDVFVDDMEDNYYPDRSLSDQSMSSIVHREGGVASPPGGRLQADSAKKVTPVMTSSPIYRCKSLPECRMEPGDAAQYSFAPDRNDIPPCEHRTTPKLTRARSQSDDLDDKVTEFFASNATDAEKERRLVDAATAVKHRSPPHGRTNLARSHGLNGYGSSPDVYSPPKKAVHFREDGALSPSGGGGGTDGERPPRRSGHLKPRDVKKRSMERSRSNSLKDEPQPLSSPNNSVTKKYFSFAF